jgi:hypothetical protein
LKEAKNVEAKNTEASVLVAKNTAALVPAIENPSAPNAENTEALVSDEVESVEVFTNSLAIGVPESFSQSYRKHHSRELLEGYWEDLGYEGSRDHALLPACSEFLQESCYVLLFIFISY